MSTVLLYADETCLVFKSKNDKDIENQLHEDFANICDWFVENKVSIPSVKIKPYLSFLNVR